MSIFSTTPARRPKKSLFNLSHELKTSMRAGDLVPVFCEEVLPGDKFQVFAHSLVRMAPMLAPIMHHINVTFHYFFVPNRIVWDEWETFITGGEDGNAVPVFPRLRASGSVMSNIIQNGSLADYMGIGVANTTSSSTDENNELSLLPFRAYQLIYNEYYRDQNLTDPIEIDKSSGVFSYDYTGSVSDLFRVRRRAWEKDYFTSALPWAQRGPEIRFPLSGNATVYYDSSGAPDTGQWINRSGVSVPDVGLETGNDGHVYSSGSTALGSLDYDPNGTLKADMTAVSGTSVNEFRRAMRLQEWQENNARGGSRYIEQLRSHFGVTSSDARLQRPEFLGGGRMPIVISEVLQTSSTDNASPQANMAGHGVSAVTSKQFRRFFEEHGYIIGIMSILPRTAYQQGIPRHFLKFDKFLYAWPEFAHLGEQEIWDQELYWDLNQGNIDRTTFGYTPRYAEYRYCPSRVSGDFKSNLSFWHMSRIFSNKPALNTQFVESDPTERIFAVDDQSATHKYWCLISQSVKAIRPLPRYGVPTI